MSLACLENFLSPTKNIIFKICQFFGKSKEFGRKKTGFNKNFRKMFFSLISMATSKFNFLIWSYFLKNFVTT